MVLEVQIYIGDEADKFAPHGFGTLLLDGPKLTEQLRVFEDGVFYQKVLLS